MIRYERKKSIIRFSNKRNQLRMNKEIINGKGVKFLCSYFSTIISWNSRTVIFPRNSLEFTMKLRRQQLSTSFLSKKPSITIQSFARIYKKNTRQYTHAHSEYQRCVHTSENWDSYNIDWHFIASLYILYLPIQFSIDTTYA